MPKTFTERLEAEIKGKGTTKIAVASAIGVHRATLAEWESGSVDPSVSNLAAMADYFGCTMDWLWGRSDTRESAATGAARQALGSVAVDQVEGAVDALLATIRAQTLDQLNALRAGGAGLGGPDVTAGEAGEASGGIAAGARKAQGERPTGSRRGAGGRGA